MKRMIRIIKKCWSFFLIHILNLEIKRTRRFNGVSLTINGIEKGGKAYFGKNSYGEVINPFYSLIQRLYNPEIVLDIGANYGFLSCVYANVFKNAKVIAVEPSKKLCKYIHLNRKNNSNDITVLRAICDKREGDIKDFSISPLNSQDNRVKGDSIFWLKEKLFTTSIDSILLKRKPFNFVFIKIDTQGYELEVFWGAEEYLLCHSNWLIKTEFAPFWLKKQGTNPQMLLEYLVNNFDVVDFKEMSFKEYSINSLFKNKLNMEDVEPFINYIIDTDNKELGWTDLLINKSH